MEDHMATQQLIDIIIKATDQASATAKKVDDQLKKVYSDVEKANSKAAKSSQKFNTELIRTGESFQVVGGGAAQAANLLGQMKLDPKFGSTLDRAKLKVSEMGYDITSLEGRLRVFGTAGQTVWTNFRTRVSSAATTLKGKLATAVDGVRAKLKSLSAGANGLGSIFGGLKGVLSMTAGMIGYDLVNGIVQAARASINAASQLDYFGKRLKMSGSETTAFRQQIDGLQKEFRKVDMKAVGATAEEMAVKFNLPKKSIGDLTRMTAVLSSTFVKEGRTQEDAILAVSDALDGQFKRLQEIGITQDTLKANGWNGNLEDQDSLIKALNKSMQEMGYEQTAKDITNLDEAWGALTIAGGQLLQKVLVPITPLLIQMIDGLLKVADAVGDMISAIGGMPDWAQLGIGVAAFGLALVGVSTAISLGMIPALEELVAGLAASALAAWDLAAAMLANPLTWVALALAAIVVVVYEVGKAFGWWTDVGSMIDAIWAGLQRLWSAFISHPDVQGFISAMIPVWNWLQYTIASVIKWVQSFFQNNSGEKFDFVRALIDTVGLAWKAMTTPIRLVITVVKLVLKAIQNWYLTTLARVNMVKELFRRLPGQIRGAISSLVSIITKPFKDAYNGVKGAVDKIKRYANGIKNISISSITDKITKPFRDAYDSVVKWVDKIKKKAKEATKDIPIVGGFFGGEDLNFYGGEDLIYSNEKLSVDMNQNINLSLDLRNVPSGLDERQLAGLINETLDSKEFINRLVNNPDFQSLDSKVKQRIVLKSNRANGRGV